MLKRRQMTSFDVNDNTIYQALSFKLNNITSYGEFSALFDYYKINMVVCTWTFSTQRSSGAAVATSPTVVAPIFRWYYDYNDNSIPTASQFRENQNIKSTNLSNRTVTMKIRPKTLVQMYRSPTTTAYVNPRREPWLETDNPEVPYYGIKYSVDGSYAGGMGTQLIGTVQLTQTYYISLRSTK
jgi:hypothetical protein